MSKDLFDISVPMPAEIGALGDTLRTFINRIFALDPVADPLAGELTALREKIDGLCARMEPHVRSDRMPRNKYDTGANGVRPYYVQGALIGPHHPMLPVVELGHAGGVTSGTVRFGVTHEGPPGCVHGGFVAFFCDQILGHHNLELALPAMTGTLEVRYLGPTPLLTDLRFEVHTAKTSERKVVNEAWIAAGERRVCEARGIFILPHATNFMGQMKRVLGDNLKKA